PAARAVSSAEVQSATTVATGPVARASPPWAPNDCHVSRPTQTTGVCENSASDAATAATRSDRPWTSTVSPAPAPRSDAAPRDTTTVPARTSSPRPAGTSLDPGRTPYAVTASVVPPAPGADARTVATPSGSARLTSAR